MVDLLMQVEIEVSMITFRCVLECTYQEQFLNDMTKRTCLTIDQSIL